ncbi:unnamed protein product, partial [Ectocarpus sp. 12 AP-2014]
GTTRLQHIPLASCCSPPTHELDPSDFSTYEARTCGSIQGSSSTVERRSSVPQERSGSCEGTKTILAFLSGGEVDARRRADMSAAVSHAPASAASAAATRATVDVEAPTLDPTRDQLRPGGHATTSGDAAVVELATDLDAGDAAAPAGSAQPSSTSRRRERSSLPLVAGLAAMMSLIFILGDLVNKRMIRPVSTGVFLLSASYCVAMLRRQWAGESGGTREGRHNNFTKEAREELITYFVFGTDPEELPTEAGAGAGAGEEGNRQKKQERGSCASRDELQASRTSSRRWQREGQRGSSNAVKAAAEEDDPARACDSGEWSTGQACIVCFGDYEPGDRLARLPCRHVYHAQCIDEWLDRAKLPSCPLCKTDLRHATPPDDRSRSISTAGGAGTGINAARVGGGSGGGEGVEFTGDNAV